MNIPKTVLCFLAATCMSTSAFAVTLEYRCGPFTGHDYADQGGWGPLAEQLYPKSMIFSFSNSSKGSYAIFDHSGKPSITEDVPITRNSHAVRYLEGDASYLWVHTIDLENMTVHRVFQQIDSTPYRFTGLYSAPCEAR